jgi:preprotein translocase subunit SecF
MTTQYKTKEQVKAEQASQDNQSQDVSPQNLSITDGVTKFYETRCEFYENVFLQADQQAAKDVMGKFLTYDKSNREAVGGAFFGNLATKRLWAIAIALSTLPC